MITLTITVLTLFATVFSNSKSPKCNSPLGVSDGSLKDSHLKASSSYSPAVGAHNGRLGTERGGGAWCPKNLVSPEREEWLEVNLGSEMLVTGVMVQGRYARGQGQEYVEFVKILTWHKKKEWKEESNKAGEVVIKANTDTFSKEKILLEKGVRTTRLRIMPISDHPRMICLRVEILGCQLKGMYH